MAPTASRNASLAFVGLSVAKAIWTMVPAIAVGIAASVASWTARTRANPAQESRTTPSEGVVLSVNCDVERETGFEPATFCLGSTNLVSALARAEPVSVCGAVTVSSPRRDGILFQSAHRS